MLWKYYAQEIGWLHGWQKSVGSWGYSSIKNVVNQTSHLVLSEQWHGTGKYIYGKDKHTENTDQNISCKADLEDKNVKPWVILPEN